ncbi:MAG: tetratricopeptide repeat protein [Verrucomicrobiae bacterium]|nr:tetratricopeptide repeat protein [Verrucomicrobiae bacterium]
MKQRRHWLAFLAMAWLTAALAAATPEEEFAQANQLCEQGRYAEAIARYEQLLKAGQVSPALYYNLGTAHFRAGQPGRAIYALRHAERLAPRDPDIRANLASIRRAVSGREEVGPRGLEALLGRLTLNEWCVAASIILWAWLGVLTLGQWRAAWRTRWRSVGWLLLAVWLFNLACLTGAAYFHWGQRVAIVAQKDVQARLAPYDVSKPVWNLPEGAEVRVLSENQDWLEIRDDRGRAGWVKRDQVLLWPR